MMIDHSSTASSPLRLFALGMALFSLLSSISCGRPEGHGYSDLTRPAIRGTHASLGLAGYTKVLCSAVFVSGRQPDTAAYQSGYFLLPEHLQDKSTFNIDWNKREVTMSLGDSLNARAKYFDDQGCIIMTDGRDKPFFEPVPVESGLPPAATIDWPLGDRNALDVPVSENDKNLIEQINQQVFSQDALTAAFIVLHNGKILIEEYANGAGQQTQLESWSMGKSLTATLIGRMIRLGYFNLDEPAPIGAWHVKGDPRASITIKNLLQMSSGLHFTSHRDPAADDNREYLDHFYIYTGAVDAFSFSINRPLQFEPGTVGRYRNCDPMSLGLIMREALGEDYWTFPQRELFDRIGIREQVMETDPYGNFLLSGYDYGTARNWARLGLLYLNDGKVDDEHILPANWASFVSTPAPGWKEPVYGGMFWLNGTGEFNLPADTYYMAGAGGQRTIIVPSLDLVVVRMGHFRGAEAGIAALNSALPLVVELVTN